MTVSHRPDLISVSVCTLGCKVNQYESQSIVDEILKMPHSLELKNFDDCCDIYIINSCTVTAQSDKKSRQMVRKARKCNKNSVIILCGCFSQIQSDKLKYLSEANYITGNKNKNELIKKALELFANEEKSTQTINVTDISIEHLYEEVKITNSERARAYIKIQDGCNSKCSYCIIPKARGSSRSRKYENIIEELTRFDEKGFKEIVLTGIEISSYGEDLKSDNGNSPPIKLITLLEKTDAYKEHFKNIKNIRTGSLDPSILNKDFIDRFKNLKLFAPHFHLSVQSASDDILKKMRRKYNAEMLYENIEYAYKNIDNLILTADIIAGFPSESESDFNKTADFIKSNNIYHTHIFPYSARKNTEAASFPCQIDEQIKKQRVKRLEKICNETKQKILTENLNKEFDVILEDTDNNGFINAKTKNYIDVKVNAPHSTIEYCHGEMKKVISYECKNLCLYVKLI